QLPGGNPNTLDPSIQQGCLKRMAAAKSSIFGCLVSLHDSSDSSALVSRCECYYTFISAGQDCKSDASTAKVETYNVDVGDDIVRQCSELWETWGWRREVPDTWWESPQGLACQFLIVLLGAAMCLYFGRGLIKDIWEHEESYVEAIIHHIPTPLARIAEKVLHRAPVEVVDSSDDEANDAKHRHNFSRLGQTSNGEAHRFYDHNHTAEGHHSLMANPEALQRASGGTGARDVAKSSSLFPPGTVPP
ncbi:unnamed protein product, partial [Polarella glacialis]